jgi:hypothetical protein
MKTLIATPRQASGRSGNGRCKSWFGNWLGLVDPTSISIAGSELPMADHYWRDVLPTASFGKGAVGQWPTSGSAVDRWRLHTWLP